MAIDAYRRDIRAVSLYSRLIAGTGYIKPRRRKVSLHTAITSHTLRITAVFEQQWLFRPSAIDAEAARLSPRRIFTAATTLRRRFSK